MDLKEIGRKPLRKKAWLYRWSGIIYNQFFRFSQYFNGKPY